ncbi:MAG: potassium-transporting ATPase subunit KdpB, partial [Alphaproteobacteria bacterium]|nr:potassium-transporting ATPase subunit KdpB [Alphaproteobacteria bacterium]
MAGIDSDLILPALWQAIRKLNPRAMVRNPVMFVVEVVTVLTTILFLRDLAMGRGGQLFSFQINLWLWFTLLFANFAEAIAEGRGKAQADTLRRMKIDLEAKLMPGPELKVWRKVPAAQLERGDFVLVEAGDLIPSDGEVVEGVASVNEAAITGESAPVIRESGGDRSVVTGGTRVLSDWIVVKITASKGNTFLDRMIALVEGAERQKTPNEIALNILLAGMTLIFVFAVAAIPGFVHYAGGTISILVLVALFVTLIPTTIGALLSAIGIAGMDRLVRFNVLAVSGRAVEAAGDVDILLLDKTGTITLGNRQASAFLPLPGVEERDLAEAAQLASLSDETPEGRSIVVLAKDKYGLRGQEFASHETHFVPFTAATRISGIDLNGTIIRKGAADAVLCHVRTLKGFPESKNPVAAAAETLGPETARSFLALVERIAKSGGTPLAVARNDRVLGLIHLKDVVKGGIRE